MNLFLTNTVQDIRYALRQLRKSPGFTMTAIVTLALGIGANTAIFTLVQGMLLRSLPVNDPKQLYRIGDTDNCCVNGGFVSENGDFDIFSYELFLQLKNSAPEFEQLAAVQAGNWQWGVRRGDTFSKELHAEFVTGNFFTMLGIGPFAGRVLGESDDTPTASPALVLSYQAWQTEFAGDPSIVGSTISIQTNHSRSSALLHPGSSGTELRKGLRISGCLFRRSRIFALPVRFCITLTRTGSMPLVVSGRERTSAHCRRSFHSPFVNSYPRAPSIPTMVVYSYPQAACGCRTGRWRNPEPAAETGRGLQDADDSLDRLCC